MGDHTEALQVDYDPSALTYEALLERIFANPATRSEPWGTQYRAAIWVATPEERAIAERVRAAHGATPTAIEPLREFFLAEDYHQKYWLRSNERLLALLDGADLVESPLAAKLNGIVGGREMRRAELEPILRSLTVPAAAADYLRSIVRP